MTETENKIIRYHPKENFGLSDKEIKSRINDGLVNVDKSIKTKSTSDIIKDNTLTLFNILNILIAAAVMYTGLYKNLMFMGVVICNCIIGISQELRARNTVERLNFISCSHANVIRNGKNKKIPIEQVVLDDILIFESGNQIMADCIIKQGKCEVNESFLTGEPDLISKNPGDLILAGSYVASGKCIAQAEHVGKENYSSAMLKESKCIKKTKSEIMETVNKIIKIISIAIIPIGGILFYRQLLSSGYDYSSAIITTSAALTSMIPEGLVLLTSSVLAVGVLRLSKKRILVQDIYCLETLARVDTLCLDKTGTITEGKFEIHDIISSSKYSKQELEIYLSAISDNINDSNETFQAISAMFKSNENKVPAEKIIPFSSEKKWSGIQTKKLGTIVMGAGEIIFKNQYYKIEHNIQKFSEDYRVITIARSKNPFEGENLPIDLEYVGIVLIKDKIRYSAAKTLNFFKKQGVDIKVISGDNPVTVSKIAKRVELENTESYIDVSTLKSEDEIREAATKYTIFGRVTPPQKQLIIKSLKESGKTVAMVGDGVNDVLAMKESDCSVAMANGSDIARNISHLVLLNSDFASMPLAVAEGRIAINNIQRSSSLFLVKTLYSFLLSILFLIIPYSYPFILIQMTLLSSLTIGIPSFVLALEPNRQKISGNLFTNIVSKALPAALTIVSEILICVGLYALFNLNYLKYSTLCVLITGAIGIMLLYNISLPLNKLRKTLLWGVSVSFFIGMTAFSNVFSVEPFNWINCLIFIPLIIIGYVIYELFSRIPWEKWTEKLISKNYST
ncbi:MAG: HAD-IC family P-type ATPase [Acutalibacteraceae bacterium]